MYNINPSLVLGQALSWAEKNRKLEDIREHERSRIDLRVYEQTGAGYFEVKGIAAHSWYYNPAAEDRHFNRTTNEDVQSAIDAGGRIQLVGPRGVSIGLWQNWENFTREVLA